MKMQADAIFEGGGVKAFGMLGALYEAERRGYTWVNVAGTSAGAIIASLVAAGYTAGKIKELVWELDFRQFKDKGWLGRIPYIGPALSLWFENGLYEGGFLAGWLREKLAARGVHTFKDLVLKEFENDPRCRYRLTVIATDVSQRKLLKLPHDIKNYNIKPDDLEVYKAVRMSASLPFFYKPYKLMFFSPEKQKSYSYIIDGGVLSNFPVWLFDGDGVPPWPTFGFKTVELDETRPSRIANPFDFFKATLSTMMEAHDKLHELDPKSSVRTISIPSLGIKTTDFETINQQKEALFQAGVQAAARFFENWDFNSFKSLYCNEKSGLVQPPACFKTGSGPAAKMV
ncbi:predicted esterase [Pelotomaculum thermopropionicum SI]|uniref:Predicted esterase n=1 Tax=Pelotomaculum thermopropionicum (strain DSM 13744 / JCM 10971 / SI) TaxID=370438 RepID=A5D3N2_PELTS|nr:predicted esterase [Pelotomaculum thermopropionicum SI]